MAHPRWYRHQQCRLLAPRLDKREWPYQSSRPGWNRGTAVPDWLVGVLGLIAGIVLLWVALVAFLVAESRKAGDPTTTKELLRLIPDVVRLTKRLASDPKVPRGTRVWLGALLVYLLIPIDLIPDFIP